jgi:hypothetical protein
MQASCIYTQRAIVDCGGLTLSSSAMTPRRRTDDHHKKGYRAIMPRLDLVRSFLPELTFCTLRPS